MYVLILKTHEDLSYMAKGAKGADMIKDTEMGRLSQCAQCNQKVLVRESGES